MFICGSTVKSFLLFNDTESNGPVAATTAAVAAPSFCWQHQDRWHCWQHQREEQTFVYILAVNPLRLGISNTKKFSKKKKNQITMLKQEKEFNFLWKMLLFYITNQSIKQCIYLKSVHLLANYTKCKRCLRWPFSIKWISKVSLTANSLFSGKNYH